VTDAKPDFGAFVPGSACAIAGKPGGPLTGLAFAAKDLIDIAGHVTGGGNPDWARTHAPADRNAPVIDRLLGAGADLVGKTITDELAFSLEGANAHYGTPINPRCPDRLPGGSSSGSAVAVAAGLVDFALGTDTGGSVRVPASFCGLYGFRPSHNRISLEGIIPFAPSYDTVGWFARDAQTLARVGQVLLEGRDAKPPSRLLLVRDAFDLCDPPCAEALLGAAKKLAIAGTIELFGGEAALWLETYRVLQGAEIWASLGSWIKTAKPRFGEAIAPHFGSTAQITADEIEKSARLRQRFIGALAKTLAPGTALLLPSIHCIAPLKTMSGAEIESFYEKALTFTCLAGHGGLPQISLPLATVQNCPIGLSVVGARGGDESLLALAATIAE